MPGRRCDPDGRRGRGAWTARPVTGGARARARCSLRPGGQIGPSLGRGARRCWPLAPGALRPPEDFPVPCAEGRPGTRAQSPPRSGAGPPGIRPAVRPRQGCVLRGLRRRALPILRSSGKGAPGRGILGSGKGAQQPRGASRGQPCAAPRRGCPPSACGRGSAATGWSWRRRAGARSWWAKRRQTRPTSTGTFQKEQFIRLRK